MKARSYPWNVDLCHVSSGMRLNIYYFVYLLALIALRLKPLYIPVYTDSVHAIPYASS